MTYADSQRIIELTRENRQLREQLVQTYALVETLGREPLFDVEGSKGSAATLYRDGVLVITEQPK